MIATLPDPETITHITPQPPTPFQFIWSVLFSNRKKLKLSAEDRDELAAADATAEPWRKVAAYLHSSRGNPDGLMTEAIDQALLKPTAENAERILTRTWTPPFHAMQIAKAAEAFDGKVAELALALIAPIVRRHLVRIAAALETELALQIVADEKAMGRLDGAATGGQSAAVGIMRQRLEEIKKQLAGSDSHLCDWKTILGPYLP